MLQSDKSQIWLYSHWGGSELPERLKRGIAAGKGRWNDESYLTKIIFGHAVPEENWKEETGYGISGRIQDNGHPISVVDVPRQKVFTMDEGLLIEGKVPDGFTPDPKRVWSFEEYAALAEVPAED